MAGRRTGERNTATGERSAGEPHRVIRRALAHLLTAALYVAAATGLPHIVHAAPSWRTQRTIGSLMLYQDDARPNRWYVAPAELAVATDADGKPDFHFLDMRYMGTAATGDQGAFSTKSLVTFRVKLPRAAADDLTRAAKELGAPGPPVEIRPFPIRRIETALIYVAIGSPDTTALPPGRFESADGASAPTGDSYWAERVYTMGLDSNTAQAFRAALEKGQVYLSLGYAFVGPALASDWGAAQVTGTSALANELKKSLAGGGVSPASGSPDSAAADSVRLHVVRAGAIEIGLDTKRYPDLMRRVDLNDRAPPGYAALDVYCYDFNNAIRPDLAEKQVEIDAEGVTGKRIKLSTSFTASQPDLYSCGIRFPVAVRLDRPYRYRVHEIQNDGYERAGPWRENATWSRILDVTSAPPKPVGVRSVLGQH